MAPTTTKVPASHATAAAIAAEARADQQLGLISQRSLQSSHGHEPKLQIGCSFVALLVIAHQHVSAGGLEAADFPPAGMVQPFLSHTASSERSAMMSSKTSLAATDAGDA